MGEQRHRDIRPGSPPWHRSCERNPEIREVGHFSSSYLSPTPVWPERDRSRLVPVREEPIYGGDIRSLSSSLPRNSESEKYGNNGCFSGLNREKYLVQPVTGLIDSVQRGEYSEKRGRQWQKMAGFSESALGTGKNSAFTKFQRDNLLVGNEAINANANRKKFGGFCDSAVVPLSLSMENDSGGSSRTCFNQRMEPTESSRDHGLMERGYASSTIFGKFGVREKRTSIVDSIVDKVERSDDIDMNIDSDNRFGNNVTSERRMLMRNDASFVGYGKDVDFRSLKLIPENLHYVDDLSFQRHGHGSDSSEDGIERIPILYKEPESPGSSCQKLVKLEEAQDMEASSGDQEIIPSHDWNSYDETADSTCDAYGNWIYEDIEQLAMLENSGWRRYQGDSTGDVIDEMASHGNSLSSTDVLLSTPWRTKPAKPYKRDVRQRLGPALSVKHRLGPALSVKHRLGPDLSVKQRLGLAPQGGKRSRIHTKVKKKHPWVKILEEKTPQDPEQNPNVGRMKISDLKTKKYAKPEPPEDSEEFKHLVQSAFLKFVKVINENSANRRKYLEQGGAGNLKCSICVSSKEFVDTLGSAQHAFFSWKVGSRSEHLGLYKAICVLMGWNSTIISNGRWVREILPPAEASSLREDLIIWPPVVFIHNSSIGNDNKDKCMIVSIELLKQILGGMGYDPKMTNICRGKAANYSTMVVSFNGTYPGLQEAERLHKLFGGMKHGRAEFQQASSSGCKMNCQETQIVGVDEIESFLYGYLGTASDLDKLDFETKKRCRVRSKKEIEAIADASLDSK